MSVAEIIALIVGAIVLSGALWAIRRQENVQARLEWQQMQDELKTLRSTSRYFSGEVERMGRDISRRDAEIEMLKTEVEVLKRKCAEFERDKNALMETINNQSRTIDDQRATIRGYQGYSG